MNEQIETIEVSGVRFSAADVYEVTLKRNGRIMKINGPWPSSAEALAQEWQLAKTKNSPASKKRKTA